MSVGIVEGTSLSSGEMRLALCAGITRLLSSNVSTGHGKRFSLGKKVSVAESGILKPFLYLS